jgi:hypothetical protein
MYHILESEEPKCCAWLNKQASCNDDDVEGVKEGGAEDG